MAASQEDSLAAQAYFQRSDLSQHPSSSLRSCHTCSKKKIRCDKKKPCSSCHRLGLACAYPPAGPRVRRTRKTIMEDMAGRIRGLEKALAEALSERQNTEQDTGGGGSPEKSISRYACGAKAAQGSGEVKAAKWRKKADEDIVIHQGTARAYYNEVLLSKVLHKVQGSVESVLETPSPIPTLTSFPKSPFDVSSFLYPSATSTFASLSCPSLHPTKAVALKLWTVYLDNVESCTVLKLLHVPTDEVTVYSAINDTESASFEDLALCFAIYFAATVSVESEEEIRTAFGGDKESHLHQFRAGLERAFSEGGALDNPTLRTLKALAIYLSALRVHNHGKGVWILNGLAIRMAQSLGLHCDGERLGLSPFESEIRRRLWWHFVSKDGRAGEDYGLESTGTLLSMTNSEVRTPLNVDDASLYPEMKKLPAPKKGWAEMTFPLINNDLSKAMQQLAAAASSSTSPSPASEEVRQEIMKQARNQVEERLQGCNPVIPKHLLTISCARHLLRKLDFTSRLQWILLRPPDSPHNDLVTEDNLVEALEILGPRLVPENEMLDRFTWARRAHPQYHIVLYILWHLYVKPDGPNTERAWATVDIIFAREIEDKNGPIMHGAGYKSAVLIALKAKALAARASGLDSHHDSAAGTVASRPRGPFISPMDQGRSAVRYERDVGVHQDEIDDDGDEWPDWTTLVQSFQSNGGFLAGSMLW